MKRYIDEIGRAAEENATFRTVLYTASHMQLVVMNLLPGENIGEEVHDLDQFIRCEHGEGKVLIDQDEHLFHKGVAVLIPAGAHHDITNTSTEHSMKLSTIYAPPNHRDGTVHRTKADALLDTEEFDGKSSE